LVQAFRAAQAAAGAAGQAAPVLLERLGTLGGEICICTSMPCAFDEFEVEDLAGAADDALAEAEAEREIFKFAGRGQHHGMGNSVVDQSHRHFLGEDFGAGKSARRRAPAAPGSCDMPPDSLPVASCIKACSSMRHSSPLF
jgi:hypothetical protein